MRLIPFLKCGVFPTCSLISLNISPCPSSLGSVYDNIVRIPFLGTFFFLKPLAWGSYYLPLNLLKSDIFSPLIHQSSAKEKFSFKEFLCNLLRHSIQNYFQLYLNNLIICFILRGIHSQQCYIFSPSSNIESRTESFFVFL